MDYNLTESQEQIRKESREFAKKYVTPISQEYDRKPEFPWVLFEKFKEHNFLGIPYPVEYGGRGMGYLDFATAVEEISAVDASAALVMCAGASLTAGPIFLAGTEEQKKKYVTAISRGESVGAFALTEPEAGSDAAGIKSTAVLRGDHYILNGEKIFITHGDVADVYVVIANIVEEGQRPRMSAFIVDAHHPGIRKHTLKYKMGIRMSSTARLEFENVEVPVKDRLGEPGKGFKIAMQTLEHGRIGIAAQAVGIAEGALRKSVKYARERNQFGHPIAEFQAIQWMLADMSTRIEAARSLVYRAAHMKDMGKPAGYLAPQAKLFCSETATYVVDLAMQIHAGYGYIGDFSEIERYYRDARITRIYEGTSEVQRLVISRGVLRENYE